MERVLKMFKHPKSDTSFDCYEEISLITYLASFNEEEILSNEVEAASNILHCAFKSLYSDHYNIIEHILNTEQHYITLVEKSSGNNFKICIHNTWLFRMFLINSLKHSDIVNNNLESNHNNFLVGVISHILKNIIIIKPLSLHLLKTLLVITTKRKDILSSSLSLEILKRMDKVATSPNAVFRQYAREISKAVISLLTKEESVLLDISLLPIRGIDMCDIVKRFPKVYIRESQHHIVRKVLSMFLRNVESKDGGALYESLIFYTFEEWKQDIWPIFLDALINIDYDGEFFQSLLKYWIPLNVGVYKNDFYNFLRNEQIDWTLKGHVLLESKKKGCTIDDKIIKTDVLTLFNDLETRHLGLKIATTYHRKTQWPKCFEIDVVLNYLYSNSSDCLEEEEAKSVRIFFSQIFLHAHNELKRNEENFSKYASIVEKIYKYCCASLQTDYFEVSAEIVFILWTIAAGCSKDLSLSYKLEKKDFYTHGENLLYNKLKQKNLWWFENETSRLKMLNCFRHSNGSSTYLTKLFTKHVNVTDFLNNIHLKNLLNENSLHASLDSEKRIKNYSEIVFQSQKCKIENLELLKQINDFIINLKVPQTDCFSEEDIFKLVLYLEIIMIATKYNLYDVGTLHKLVEKSLVLVENLINSNNSSTNLNYNRLKILEAFINNVMLCMIENVDILWSTVNKEKVIQHLIMIIQRSNMKRPLSLSVEVLKRFGSKMIENESDKNFKVQFLHEALKSLVLQTTVKSDLKIRRNPESRLVIHAMCSSDANPNKPLLKWVLTSLITLISDPKSSDSAIASSLHTIEILISDNSLQGPTLPFVTDIIVQCIELFARSSWIVRNADLQLTRAIIDRFYGVCLDVCNRPKCIEDLLVLFPNLPSYFYSILSCDKLDERAILAFQFFSESQRKEHLYTTEITEISTKYFLQLFVNILQKYPNHYGKMAARSFLALCLPKDIPRELCSVIYFFKTSFKFLNKNIFYNFVFLIQQLYEKYKNSFHCCINKENINVINFAVEDLLEDLRKYDSHLFDFILFKVRPKSVVLAEFLNNESGEDFQKRLWLHNNISFLLINTDSKEIKNVLNKVLPKKLLKCIQIKILTILISKLEGNEFNRDVSNEILQILFEKSVCVDDADNYLLNCYFKTILVFYRFSYGSNVEYTPVQFQTTSNIYKVMIYVLYFSKQNEKSSLSNKQLFYKLVESKYMNFNSYTDELKNYIISTLPYLYLGAPKELKLKIFKLIFYSSLYIPTYLEAYKCITLINRKSYSSILGALKDFFTFPNLMMHLKDEALVKQFFKDVIDYLPEHAQQVQTDGYYSEESEVLIPRLFLEKIINRAVQNV